MNGEKKQLNEYLQTQKKNTQCDTPPYRGLSQVTNWVRLKFATMNLKKYAIHRWKRLNAPQPSSDFSLFFNFLLYFNFKTLKLS